MTIYWCQTASQVSLFIGFLISWICLPAKTGTPRIKVISQYSLIKYSCKKISLKLQTLQRHVKLEDVDPYVKLTRTYFLENGVTCRTVYKIALDSKMLSSCTSAALLRLAFFSLSWQISFTIPVSEVASSDAGWNTHYKC
jgi:hypothetical protein